MFKSYRNFRIRANDWTDENEEQYKYDIAWEKRFKGLKLSDKEKAILKELNPNVKITYTSITIKYKRDYIFPTRTMNRGRHVRPYLC
jgi:hypothetical protein